MDNVLAVLWVRWESRPTHQEDRRPDATPGEMRPRHLALQGGRDQGEGHPGLSVTMWLRRYTESAGASPQVSHRGRGSAMGAAQVVAFGFDSHGAAVSGAPAAGATWCCQPHRLKARPQGPQSSRRPGGSAPAETLWYDPPTKGPLEWEKVRPSTPYPV
jgi:hypothetical protein